MIEARDARPLTIQQLAMLDFMEGRVDSYYVMTDVFLIRGHIDIEMLRGALGAVLERHEALRSVFPSDEDYFVVRAFTPAMIDEVFEWRDDIVTVEEALSVGAADADEPMDLETSLPLRIWLCTTAEGPAVLYVSGHHLVMDGWSFKNLYSEIASLLHGEQLRPAVGYSEAAASANSGELKLDSSLFRHEYREVRALHARVAHRALGPAAHLSVMLEPTLARLLREVAGQLKVTPYAIGASCMIRALGQLLGDEEVIIGSASTGRTSSKAIKAIGYFSTTIFVGGSIAAGSTRDVIAQVAAQAFAWQSSPRQQWEQLLAAHDAMDLYPVKFSCERSAMASPDIVIPTARVERVARDRGDRARRPLDISVLYAEDEIRLDVTFRTDAVTALEVKELARTFERHLHDVLTTSITVPQEISLGAE